MTIAASPPTDLGKAAPAAYRALTELGKQATAAGTSSGLDPKLVELVKIRTSQFNGCAFCLRMHSREAIAQGESSDRLAVLAAWRESQHFTPSERAALALAERTTLLASRDVHHPEDQAALTGAQAAAVHWLTVVMNAWNRVAIASDYPDVS